MLKQLQNSFKTSVLQKDLQDLSIFSSSDSEARLNIYRNNVVENLKESLHIVFPGVWVLLGEECASSLAYALIRNLQNLPNSGCLDDWDSGFADFIAAKPELASLPYIRDYANFEWIKHLSYSAKNVNSILTADLQAIPEDLLGNLQFSFVPSLFLYTSDYPIQQIHSITENPNAESIELRKQQVFAVIVRPNNDVITLWITKELWLFLDYLKHGGTLDVALTKISEQYPSFDTAQALSFMLQNQLIKELNT